MGVGANKLIIFHTEMPVLTEPSVSVHNFSHIYICTLQFVI